MSNRLEHESIHELEVEPGYRKPDAEFHSISINQVVAALGQRIIELEKLQLDLHPDTQSMEHSALQESIDSLQRQTAYWMDDEGFLPEGGIKQDDRGMSVAHEAWTGPTLDEALYVSREIDPSTIAGRISMRPSDPEGPVHRKLFYAEIEVDYKRVLSPCLSGGSEVALISDKDQLFYDDKSERLSVAGDSGSQEAAVFDGWLITDPQLAATTPMEMAVADCPSVYFQFRNQGALVASGGAHSGWPNILNGLGENYSDVIEQSGIVYDSVHIVVGPGATDLVLPTRLLDEYGIAEFKDAFVFNGNDAPGFEGQETFKLDSVALATQVFSGAVERDGVHVTTEDTGLNTLDENNKLASYRREGKYGGDDLSQERPQGGRFLAVFVPDVRLENRLYQEAEEAKIK